jgi:hypothetical protein
MPRPRSRWPLLLRPKWLAWHAFAVLAAAGMLGLGDWQLGRAEAGNELSWAYTVEWPLFAILGAVFWAKTLREELRPPPAARGEADGTGTGTGDGIPDRVPAGPALAEPAPAGATGADADDSGGAVAYAARLSAEVRRHGRWHGLR